MNWEVWTTLGLLGLMFGTLCSNKFNSEMVMFGYMNIFWLLGIINDKDVYNSFANNTILTIGGLYIITNIISQSGIIHRICYKIFGNSKSPKMALFRMLLFTNAMSGFINNTPLVAILSPIITDWARLNKVSRSKFLIPLSYASITGGCITIIGTSTNLVVNQLLKKGGFEGIGFFEIALVNLPAVFVSILYFLTIGYWLLPNNRGGLLEMVETNSNDKIDEIKNEGKKYVLKFIYKDNQVRTVENVLNEINLKINDNLQKLDLNDISKIYRSRGKNIVINHEEINEELSRVYLADVSVETNNVMVNMDLGNYRLFSKIQGSFILKEGDEVILSLILNKVSELIKIQKEITFFSLDNLDQNELVLKDIHFFEVVISPICRLLETQGSINTIKRLWKRTYDAEFIALKHKGNQNQIDKHTELSKLEVGDIVLIMADQIFYEKYKNSKDFYNIAEMGKIPRPLIWKDYIPSLLFLVFIVLNTLEIGSSAFLVQIYLFILVLGKYVSYKNFFRMIDLEIIFLMSTSIAIANSMENSGLAENIGSLLNQINISFFPTIILLYFISLIITEFVTNNAAAAIMVPIIIAINQNQGYSLPGMAITVMIASSCGFSIPYGYSTHLIVFGPGGYTLKDFLKVGIPLNFLYLIIASSMVFLIYS